MARDVFGDEQPLGDNATSGWAVPPANAPTANAAPTRGPVPAASTTITPGFGPQMPGASAGSSQVSAPVTLLGVAGLCVVAALGLGSLAHGRPLLAVIGWVLGGFVSVSVLAWFTLTDSARRADAWYTSRPFPNVLRSCLLVSAVLVVALNAYQFADWKSRQ